MAKVCTSPISSQANLDLARMCRRAALWTPPLTVKKAIRDDSKLVSAEVKFQHSIQGRLDLVPGEDTAGNDCKRFTECAKSEFLPL